MNRALLIAVCLFAPLLLRGQVGGSSTALADAELRQKVVGVWAADGLCLHGVTTNTADGRSFSRQWVTGTNCNVGVSSWIESVWRIEDGIMVSTVTKSSATNITGVGRVFRTKIIRIDKNELAGVPLGIGVAVTNVVRRIE